MKELTPAQIERLGLLAEELSEAVALVGKILRHGFDSYNPDDPDPAQLPNWQLLGRELGDVEYAISLLVKAEELSRADISTGRELAERKKPKYLHFQE